MWVLDTNALIYHSRSASRKREPLQPLALENWYWRVPSEKALVLSTLSKPCTKKRGALSVRMSAANYLTEGRYVFTRRTDV